MQLPFAQIGIETQLFEILSEDKNAVASDAELARKTKVDPILMSQSINSL